EENSSIANALEDYQIIAPAFMKLEMINVLRKYHFLRSLNIQDIVHIYDRLITLVDNFEMDEQLLPKAIEISLRINHPIYDCLFLALAQMRQAPFFTLDQRLRTKADTMGILTFDGSK